MSFYFFFLSPQCDGKWCNHDVFVERKAKVWRRRQTGRGDNCGAVRAAGDESWTEAATGMMNEIIMESVISVIYCSFTGIRMSIFIWFLIFFYDTMSSTGRKISLQRWSHRTERDGEAFRIISILRSPQPAAFEFLISVNQKKKCCNQNIW